MGGVIYDFVVIGVPAEIGGIGSTQQKLRVRPGFDPIKAQIAPDEYFLLSRIDGKQTLREVLLATGLPVERGLQIVMRLRSLGALLLPDETGPNASAAAARVPAANQAKVQDNARAVQKRLDNTGLGAVPSPGGPMELDLALDDPSSVELEQLAESCDLSEVERRKILAMARLVHGGDAWKMLGVGQGADARALKRAYFKLSKDFHPDRYYGRQLGSFAHELSDIFEGLSRAYENLVNPDKQASANPNAVVEQFQTPQEYATELFSRATSLEVGGDPLSAMKLFSAAIRLDPQTKYLRRSASCALAAGQPHTALEHAKKAQSNSPSDPSLARLLATAFKACGKLTDAEDVLVMAMALKSENDVLMAELGHDLAEVRRLLRG